MKIILGVTGCIAAYKAPDIISGLRATGHDVRVIVTAAALEFITEKTLAVISHNPVVKDFNELDGVVRHIELAEWCDALVIAPATANTLTKLCFGIADNLLTTVALAVSSRREVLKVLAPAMNPMMWESPSIQTNVHNLEIEGKLSDADEHGWNIIQPEHGKMACGSVGMGKLPKPRKIVEVVNQLLVGK